MQFKLSYVLLGVATLFLAGCASSQDTSDFSQPTVSIADPFNPSSAITVTAREIPVSANHSMLIPSDWSESFLASPLGFNIVSYSDFNKWQKLGVEDASDLIVPLSNMSSLNFIRLPAELPNGELALCSVLPDPDFFVFNVGPGDPRGTGCAFAIINPDDYPDFKGVSSAAQLVEKVVALEGNLYKTGSGTSDLGVSLDIESSRDGAYAVFLVKYSSNPRSNYGGVIFAEKDNDGITTSYNAAFISNKSVVLNSIEDLRNLPEFSILQTLEEKQVSE